MVKKKVLRNRLQRDTVGLNPYAHMLMDPEHGPTMGIPDEYPFPTHKARICMTRQARFDADGNSFCSVGKSLSEFFGQKASTGEVGQRKWVFDSPYVVPVRPWSEDDQIPAVSNVNATFPPHFIRNSGDYNDPMEVTPGSIVSGTSMELVETVALNAGDTCTVTGETTDTTADAWTVFARFLLASGGESTVASATLTGGGVTVGAVLTAPATAIGLIDCGISRVLGTGTWTAVQLAVSIGVKTDLDYEPVGKEDMTEWNTLKSLGSRARIVAMSLWAQYSGSLTSNGKIACGQIGHSDLTRLPKTDLDTLASLPGFYNDSLLKPNEAGGYAWFRPMSVEDTLFEDLDSPDDVGSRLMCAIHANDADAQNVTYRMCAVIEIQTTNQVVTPTSNLVNPPMIWEAQRELRDFPSGMGNTSHLKSIANKLKSFATTAAHTVAKLGPHALQLVQYLKSLGANIAPEIEMGLSKAVQYAPAIGAALV